MKALKWLDDNLELTISGILLALMVITVLIQVLSRYVLVSAISWTEEATRYMFVWMVFLSIGICAKRGKHIRITILQSKVPQLTPYLNLLSDVVFAVVAGFCGVYGYNVVTTFMEAGQRCSSLPLFKWQVYVIVPIGFAIAIFRLAQDFVINVKSIIEKKGE